MAVGNSKGSLDIIVKNIYEFLKTRKLAVI